MLTLSTAPALLSGVEPGASSHDTSLGYAPTATDFIYPVGDPRTVPTYANGNANGYQITQMFDNSCDPSLGQGFYYDGQYFCGHTGVDLSDRAMGGVVHAMANGVVVFSGYNSSYGEMIRIQHVLSDGSYIYSQYEHLEYGSRLVSYGQVVTMGQPIGLVGNTGFVTGAHLHFEIKSVNEDGVGYTFGNNALIIGYYDPIAWIEAHTQQLLPTATATLVPASSTPDTQALTASSTLTATTATTDTAAATETATATTDNSGNAGNDNSGNTGNDNSGNTDNTGSGTTTPISESASMSTTASSGGEQVATLADFYGRYRAYVVVTADHLNVRSGSGYEFVPMNSVAKGARLGYLGISGNGWVHVALPSNIEGYVAREWVKGKMLPKLPPVQMSVKLKPPFDVVADTRYPARGGPMMHDAAIEPLRRGEKMTYLGTLGSWDKVVLPTGRIGWVLNWYLHEPAVRWSLAPAVPTASTGNQADQNQTSGDQGTPPSNTTTQPVSHTVATKPAVSVAGPYVVTTVDGLNVRRGPRLAAAVIESVKKGTKLGLRGYHTSWDAVVAPDGTQGFVLGSLVRPLGATGQARSSTVAASPDVTTTSTERTASTPTAKPPSTMRQPRVSRVAPGFQAPYLMVTVPMTTGANLRSAPGLKSTILASEPHGAVLSLHATKGDWAYVETKSGLIGWMMRDLTAPTDHS